MYHVKVKIHGLVSSLGRQLIGCVGTIVRVGTAEKRYGANVDRMHSHPRSPSWSVTPHKLWHDHNK